MESCPVRIKWPDDAMSVLFLIARLPILFRTESNDLIFPDLLKLYMLARTSSLSRVRITLLMTLPTSLLLSFSQLRWFQKVSGPNRTVVVVNT